VLPVCVGEATKLVPFLQAGEKVYEAEARLGVERVGGDAEGHVVEERDASRVTRADVEAALAGFVGRILQVPPMHSALRVGGKRLYELARAGVEVEREPREVEVTEARLIEFSVEEPRVRFVVRCGKGTYIRSLAGDLGARLGVGAHLTALRRLRVGPFTVDDAVALDALEPGRPPALRAPAEALGHLPALELDATQARDVRDGKLRAIAELPRAASDGLVRLLRPDGTLLAVADQAPSGLTLLRVFS
jgi:tRNA pseudouridine55 synthase